MKHCVSFQPYDIWFLENSPEFSSRKLFLGQCPKCLKPVLELSQISIFNNKLITIKKVGFDAHKFAESFKSEVLYSLSECNRMKFKSVPFGWVFGINKEKKSKNGTVITSQYASDFFGNKKLVKKRTTSY